MTSECAQIHLKNPLKLFKMLSPSWHSQIVDRYGIFIVVVVVLGWGEWGLVQDCFVGPDPSVNCKCLQRIF